MTRNPGRDDTSTKLLRIAELARNGSTMAFTSLAHHIDQNFLREAYARTRKDGASGVDGQTAQEYAQDLEANLASLLERFKSGSYRAPPVRGVEIDKGGGKKRLLGIPTFEDKVLQRAVAMVLTSIYEQDFLPCSYGSRPGRSAHGALAALWQEATGMGGCWALEADISRFFDTLDHGVLRTTLDQRVRDGIVRRTIDKWLKAGVLLDGSIHSRTEGTPQGGVISPLLANIYLHEVLDVWFEQIVKPRLAGRAVLIRYVDDFVILFTSETDARRVMEVLPKRFGRFGLKLHPEKTKLIEFKPPTRETCSPREHAPAPRTFDLLGFTHFWGRTRKGRWAVKRKTMRTRLTRALRAIWTWCRVNLHMKVTLQRDALHKKLEGHYQYYGITGNSASLSAFAHWVRRIWRHWLNRRGKKRSMPWPRFRSLLKRYPLPAPCVVHSVCRRAANPRP